MPQLPAALLILIERPHPDKQELLCLAAATAQQLNIVALCRSWQDALTLYVNAHIVAVVCALEPGDDARLAFERAGVALVVARQQQSRIRRSVAGLVAKLWRRGLTPKEIAEDLGVPTADVRQSLDKIHRGPD